MLKTKSGIFLFNIIPSYRPGMSKVFDYAHYELACTPSLAQRTKQNTLYTSLEDIAGESLSDLDLLYIMATDGTRVFAKINWVDPGSFDFTESGSPAFAENEGFTGGSPAYLDTGWNPAVDGVNFQLDESGAFCYVNNECTAGIFYQFGVDQAATDTTALAAKYSGSTHRYGINSSTVLVGTSVSSIGFFHTRRVADDDLRLYKNGSQVGSTSTQASTGKSGNARTMAILAFNANGTVAGHSDAQVGCFGIGASLTGQESALYTAWNTYFQSL